jgi:hypothetical protein
VLQSRSLSDRQIVSGSTAPGADLQESEVGSGRPLPVPTVSRHGCFFQNGSTRTVLVRCVLQTRIAVRRGERKTKELSPQVLTARCTFGCGPFAVSKGKDTIRRRACPNRTQRRPAGLALHNMPAFGGRGTLGLLPEACTVSQHQVMSSRTTLGRRSRAARAALCCTGTHRVAVQTSHRPSMRVRTLLRVAPRQLVCVIQF